MPRSPYNAVYNGGVAGQHEHESEVQDADLLPILEEAERMLNVVGKNGWAGIDSPEMVASRIQSVIKVAQKALKTKGGTASVAA